MCQGVIVSLVKFKVGGKPKRVVLSGIGSHSDLLADSKDRLVRAGWSPALGESVISIESNFSEGYNRFTLECGASKAERAILAREYKKCAGDARALIAHVKRCGKIDDALLSLLTAPTLAEYERVTAPALAEYERVET